jgi:hypothetical protein
MFEHDLSVKDKVSVITHKMNEVEGSHLSSNSAQEFFAVTESGLSQKVFVLSATQGVVAQLESTKYKALGEYTWVSSQAGSDELLVLTAYKTLSDFYFVAVFKLIKTEKMRRAELELWQDKVAIIRERDLKSVTFRQGHLMWVESLSSSLKSERICTSNERYLATELIGHCFPCPQGQGTLWF